MATVLTRKKKTTATIIVVGASTAELTAHLPAENIDDLNSEAARLAKRHSGGTSSLLINGHRYILTAPNGAAHLIGGEQWRLAAAAAVRALREAEINAATLLLDGDLDVLQAFVEGVALADYRFMECKKDDKRPELSLHLGSATAAMKKAVSYWFSRGYGAKFCPHPG